MACLSLPFVGNAHELQGQDTKVIKLSLFLMVGLTVVIAIGLRWREERMPQAPLAPTPRGLAQGWVAAQKRKVNRWFTAAALAAVVTLLFLGGINWLRIWQG